MNVQPSIDEEENVEVLMLPKEVIAQYDQLALNKKDKKDKISQLKLK